MKVYVAGKVSKDSMFGTHHWRDNFCAELERLSGLRLTNLDAVKGVRDITNTVEIFARNCNLINQADVFIVYFSDDISVGGSQEILIARYLRKPVVGLAPRGGKFNGRRYEMPHIVFENYQDPFVYSTCDVVCETVEEVAKTLKNIGNVQSTGLDIIDKVLE